MKWFWHNKEIILKYKNMKRNKFCEGKSKLAIFLILVVIILALAAGFFYYKIKANRDLVDLNSTAPKLFEKGDYRVEDRPDGQYIVVNKVGLTAKVPDGWRVEFSNNTSQDVNEYWVDLYSQDATGIDYLKKGCVINIIAGDAKENNQDIRQEIGATKDGIKNCDSVFSDKVCEIYKINEIETLRWMDKDRGIAGQSLGIRIPVGTEKIASINATFSSSDKEKCFVSWDEFVKNIAIN